MRSVLTIILALVLTGCPGKKAETPATGTAAAAPAAAPAPEKRAAPAKEAPAGPSAAGCYQWQGEEGEASHQIRIVPQADGYEGTYLGWLGSDFVAYFRLPLHDLRIDGDTVLFTLGTRDLWGEPIGMDQDLSGKESDGFTRTGWAFEGKLEKDGISFTCVAEGQDEHCWVESGRFARVAPELCGPAPRD